MYYEHKEDKSIYLLEGKSGNKGKLTRYWTKKLYKQKIGGKPIEVSKIKELEPLLTNFQENNREESLKKIMKIITSYENRNFKALEKYRNTVFYLDVNGKKISRTDKDSLRKDLCAQNFQ